MNLDKLVMNEMRIRKSNKEMFSVYDITRIIRNNVKTLISHDDVRKAVESQYQKIGLLREIAYHLPFSPPPQCYYQNGQDIIKYDPDALDPTKEVITANLSQLGVSGFYQCKPSSISGNTQPQVEYFYACVDKKTGERAISISIDSNNRTGLYLDKNGPAQLLRNNPNHEVVKYKVTLEMVKD